MDVLHEEIKRMRAQRLRLERHQRKRLVASWFETLRCAALLTMRNQNLILRSGVFAASRRMKPLNWEMP